jgi:hypothetical protein
MLRFHFLLKHVVKIDEMHEKVREQQARGRVLLLLIWYVRTKVLKLIALATKSKAPFIAVFAGGLA